MSVILPQMDTVVFLINAAAVENSTEHTLIPCMWAHIATAHREGILQGKWQHASVHMLKMLRKSVTARVQQIEFQTKFSGTIFSLPIPTLPSHHKGKQLLIKMYFSNMSLF